MDQRPPWSPSWSGGTPTPPSDSDEDNLLLDSPAGSAQPAPQKLLSPEPYLRRGSGEQRRLGRLFNDSPARFSPTGSGSPARSPMPSTGRMLASGSGAMEQQRRRSGGEIGSPVSPVPMRSSPGGLSLSPAEPSGSASVTTPPRSRQTQQFFAGVLHSANRAVELYSNPEKAAKVEAARTKRLRRRSSSRGRSGGETVNSSSSVTSPGGDSLGLAPTHEQRSMQEYIKKLESQVAEQQSALAEIAKEKASVQKQQQAERQLHGDDVGRGVDAPPPPPSHTKEEEEELRDLERLKALQMARQRAGRAQPAPQAHASPPRPSQLRITTPPKTPVDVLKKKKKTPQNIVLSPEAESFIGEVSQ